MGKFCSVPLQQEMQLVTLVQPSSIFSLLQYRSLTNNKAAASLQRRRPQTVGPKPAGLLGTSHCNFQAHKMLQVLP